MPTKNAAQRAFSSEFLPELAQELATSEFTPNYANKSELLKNWRQETVATQKAADFLISFAKTFIETRARHMESILDALIRIIADHYSKFLRRIYKEKSRRTLTAELVVCMRGGNSADRWADMQRTHQSQHLPFRKQGQWR